MGRSDLPPVVLAAERQCIFICGSTGTGKSAAAVKLALQFHGEIINADALQLYKGLNIATAKITDNEMCGVPHHLLNILESNEKANVRFFREMAMNVVEEVNQRSALPIVVGGTHYYIEGLLFQNYERESLQPQGTGEYQESLQEMSSYAQLQQIDPIVAATIHPKDTRRIEKALANHLKQTHPSQVEPLRMSLRYPNSIVVIVDCDMEILKSRLRTRVDQMIENGLVTEVLDFYHKNPEYTKSGETHDLYGVNIAIGYKELMPYILEVEKSKESDSNSSEISRNLQEILDTCIERIKVSTIQYARRQRTWINNSLTKKCQQAGVPVITLDLFSPPTLDVKESTTVYSMEDLFSTISRIREAQQCKDQSLANASLREPSFDQEHIWKKRKIFTCDTCSNQSFQGYDQYQIHLKSKRHKRLLSSRKKKEKNESLRESSQSRRMVDDQDRKDEEAEVEEAQEDT